MGFIEQFLRKNPTDVAEADIVAFIARKIEENLSLEYKDIRFYENSDELSKKVSGFGNAAGGLLFLGVSEQEPIEKGPKARIFPAEITWGDPSLSRETLEDRLNARVRPRIDGLRIVPTRRENSQVIFLIDVPQSENPPHMAFDNRYYKRLNFETVPMEHYEVADLFGKRRRPHVKLLLEFLQIKRSRIAGSVAESVTLKVRLYFVNLGKAAARHTQATVQFDNLEITSTARGNFERIDDLRKGVHTIQLTYDVGVLHVSTQMVVIGEIDLKVRDVDLPIRLTWSVVAEDMELSTSQSGIPSDILEGMRGQLQSGQTVFLVPQQNVAEEAK